MIRIKFCKTCVRINAVFTDEWHQKQPHINECGCQNVYGFVVKEYRLNKGLKHKEEKYRS